jgi:Skp family chaperone for outer membrane proteins
MTGLQKIKIAVAAIMLTAGIFVGNAAASAQKIATVDLEKVFRNYYRTKIIDQNFSEQGKVYRNYIARQAEILKKDEELYRQKRDSALNVALSPEERQKRQQEAAALERSLKVRRAELERYAADRAKVMKDTAARERKKVIDEIRAEIRRRAALEGYTLVLDASGKSLNDVPFVLYGTDSIDITDKVLAELNRGAAGQTPEKKQ